MSVTNERIEAKLRYWADTFRARRHHELSAAACMVWAVGEIDRLRAELMRRSDHRTRWGEDGAATVGCDCTHEIRQHTARGCRDCECVGRRV
jgi:hypothetical protein